jgi:hypothetical protein
MTSGTPRDRLRSTTRFPAGETVALVACGWSTATATGNCPGRSGNEATPERPGHAVNGQVLVPAGGHRKVLTLGLINWFWRLLVVGFGLGDAVGLAIGHDDVGVVQEPVEQADRGGVFGRNRPQASKGQWLAIPRARRS